MGKPTNFKFSRIQNILLGATVIVLLAYIWEMVPIHNALKVAICCFWGYIVFQVVFSFANYLGYFKIITSDNLIITITLIVFVAFPLIISILYSIHKNQYLLSYPTDNRISIKIACDIDRIGGHGSIGNDWEYKHYLNDKEFKNGEVIIVNAEEFFTITSQFIELDGIDDVGKSTSKQYRYSENENYKKTLTISQNVHVVERGGRRYAGSTADFNATYKLKRVIPTSMSYWNVFLYTSNDTEYSICVFLLGGQILCVICVIFILINGRKKQLYAEKQEQQRKEQEYLAGKATFLEKIRGKSLRQVAGVPLCVSFDKGLPIDNNDTPYGSFTVYCSISGKCYHNKVGCCSAHYPAHYLDVKKRLRPCSKCCAKQKTIPQWYIDYNDLKRQANYYQIDLTEENKDSEGS